MEFEPRDEAPVLVVEDSDEDFEVLNITFANLGVHNPILRCTEGAAVLPLLQALSEAKRRLPGLVLLDLNLIGIDGREVLRRLKAHAHYRKIPVVVLSTSASRADIDTCYLNGAASYVVKPVNLAKLEQFIAKLKGFWLETAMLPRTN